MSLTLTRVGLHAFSIAAISVSSAIGGALGPPRITVRPVTDAAAAPAGAVLLIEASHHSDIADLNVTARAEGLVSGKRVSLPLRVTRQSVGHFSLTRQWQTGTPWVLILSAEQGANGEHGVAEAIIKVDASGAFAAIEYPAAGWIGRTDTPKRTAPAEIEARLASLVAHR